MKKIDYKLFIAVVILSLFGVLMIFSASGIWAEYKFNDEFKYLKLQNLSVQNLLTLNILNIFNKI